MFIKRDDLTGLAFGGNKARKFEFAFAEALAEDADVVITGTASQSNHARQYAVAAAKLGLECYLVNRRDHRSRAGVNGNLCWVACWEPRRGWSRWIGASSNARPWSNWWTNCRRPSDGLT